MRGYKAFHKDWTCSGKQYKVGETFEEDVQLLPCKSGMHFCDRIQNVFLYYTYDPGMTVVAEVEALGDVKTDDGIKFCTNKLRIIREISWDEVQKACNTGNRNTGNCNTGNCNTGNCNTGDWNTGSWNTGSWNTGNYNTGNRNTGDSNTGNCNTGNRNTGNCNTGDWNKSSFNSGCFMTIETKIMMFNKPSDWTYRDWMNSKARYLLNQIPNNVVKWVCAREMSDKEKRQHPEHKTIGGYLKVLDERDCAQLWWDGLKKGDKKTILNLPNFDASIFKECTGIDVGAGR